MLTFWLITAVLLVLFFRAMWRMGRRVERVGKKYGLTFNRNGFSASLETLEGSLMGVPIRLSTNQTAWAQIEVPLSVAVPTGTMLSREMTLPRGNKEGEIGHDLLDRRTRWLPTGDSEARLTPAACAVLAHWFRSSSFRVRSDVLSEVAFEPDKLCVSYIRAGNLERCLAEVVALVKAMEGSPIEGKPLAALRNSRLPKARVVED